MTKNIFNFFKNKLRLRTKMIARNHIQNVHAEFIQLKFVFQFFKSILMLNCIFFSCKIMCLYVSYVAQNTKVDMSFTTIPRYEI